MKAPAQVKIPTNSSVDAAMIELFGAAGYDVAPADEGQVLVKRAAELRPIIGERGAFPVAVDTPFDDAEIASLCGMMAALAAAA